MPNPSDTAVFNSDAMLNRLRGDLEHAIDLIRLYQYHSPQMLQTAVLAAVAGDMEALASAAHRLKGATAHVHGEFLHQLAGRIEHLARANHKDRATALLEELQQAWFLLIDALTEFLPTQLSS